jgi:hypothetical protein
MPNFISDAIPEAILEEVILNISEVFLKATTLN